MRCDDELPSGLLARGGIIGRPGETRRVKQSLPQRAAEGRDDDTSPEHLAFISPAEAEDERTVDMMLAAPLRDWVPRRGRWLGLAVAALAFGAGALAGATWGLHRALGLGLELRDHGLHRALDASPRPARVAHTAGAGTGSPTSEARRGGGTAKTQPGTAASAAGADRVVAPPAGARPAPPPTESTSPSPVRTADTPATLVEVEVTSEPPGAMVRAAGTDLGRTPIAIFLSSARVSSVRFELDGHDPRTVRWSARAGRRAIHVVLQPWSDGAPTPAPAP